MQVEIKDKEKKVVTEAQERKMKGIGLAKTYRELGIGIDGKRFVDKAARLESCSTYIQLKKTEDGKCRLHKANFCHVRLCPVCLSRVSQKVFCQTSRIMDVIQADYKFLFLTLTIENVPGDQLDEAITQILESFDRLAKRQEFETVIKGWFRTLEITRNWKSDTWHPHLHMILVVSADYAKKGHEYLSFEWWRKTWQECVRSLYVPMVRIEAVKPRKGVDYTGAVSEVTKYVSKISDYFEPPEWLHVSRKRIQEAVYELDIALHRRRLVAYGGIMKQIHKRLNFDDPETGDLSNDDGIRSDLGFVIVTYRWSFANLQYKPDFLLQSETLLQSEASGE